MKQIVLCLIGILLASFVSAQKINHPSLLYTPQRIQQVKQRMQNEPKLREAWEDIQKTGGRGGKTPKHPPMKPYKRKISIGWIICRWPI